MTNNENYHIPVMLNECLDGLNINPSGTYVDVTFGGGGHSRAIFQKLNKDGMLISVDQDPDAHKNAWEAPNFKLIAGNFAYLKNHLRVLGIKSVDGILADLGVSSHQFDEESRGFSIHGDAPLDMRMNPIAGKTAIDVVNDYTDEELYRMFKTYGEIQNTGRLVNEIVKARSQKKIKTTGELREVATKCSPKHREHKYLAQVFQAIRIEVNDEMDVLEKFLESCADMIKPGGRLVVMSYHSLEDRMIKNYMKRGSIDGKITKDFFGNILKPFNEIVRHPITPTEDELELNSRSRSAKLRIAERNGE
ncbi:MAG: 16S rRNA (cytosine(1402)-N(4))-methyltransferase RsmH [Bacteroidetes bacterium]|nr:MAG: 16S rRNA (cytosine(1402)-N(4))-methyltransferase RsmH [Bacteroidota bacterium]